MIDVAAIWFFIFLIPLVPITFRALMALDFAKLFLPNAVWQIRLLVLLLSVIIAFLFSFAMYTIIDLIIAFF